MDISGMLCTCGKKLKIVNHDDGGCCNLACSNPRHEKFYRIPLVSGMTLPFPWEIKKHKEYKCRVCGARISEEQAKKTYEECGRAVCETCQK